MSRKSSQSDVKRRDAIAAEGRDDSDAPGRMENVFERVPATFPPPKKQLTIRLDEDVLAWLKGQGRGYHGLSTAYQKNGHSIRPLISMLKAADL